MHCILLYVYNKLNSGRIFRKRVIVVTGRRGRGKGGRRLFTINFFIFYFFKLLYILNPVSVLSIEKFKLELFFIKNVYSTPKQLNIIQ